MDISLFPDNADTDNDDLFSPDTISLPVDSTPSWHGRLIRKGKYVADVNLLAVFGRSANKLDIL